MCYIEGSNHSPLPVGYALANAAQYAVILHCHKGPLVTHSNCRLGPQGLFFFFFFWCHKVVLANLHEGLVSLWCVKILVNGSHTCHHIGYFSQQGFMSVYDALCSTTQVTDEGIKLYHY